MTRLQRALAGLLILQVILVAVVYWPRGTQAQPGEPLLGEFSPEEVAALIIQDNEGNQVELAKAGDTWVLPEAENYPANAEKITPLLEKVAAIQTGRLVTRTAASHKRLQVAEEDFLRRVQFQMADGREYTLYLGSSAGARATHVRLGEQNEVYLTGEVTAFQFAASANNWIDTAYLSIPKDQVVRVELQNANGTFQFQKDANGQWMFLGLESGEELDQEALTALITRFSNLRLTQPLGKQAKPEYGLDSPAAVVTLTTQSDTSGRKTHTVRIGAEDPEDNTYIVQTSESEYIVKVSSFAVKDLGEKTRQDFLLQPTP